MLGIIKDSKRREGETDDDCMTCMKFCSGLAVSV
jgi:hypothetical protein